MLDVTCCARLHTLSHVVGSCAKFETGQMFSPVGANGRNGSCRVRLHVAYSVTFSYLIWLQNHSNRCFKCVAIPLFYQVLSAICVLIKHLDKLAHESFVFVLFCFLLKVNSELNCPLDLAKSREDISREWNNIRQWYRLHVGCFSNKKPAWEENSFTEKVAPPRPPPPWSSCVCRAPHRLTMRTVRSRQTYTPDFYYVLVGGQERIILSCWGCSSGNFIWKASVVLAFTH